MPDVMRIGEPVADPKPWVAWGVRYASKVGSAYFEPRTVLLTHPHDGHTLADTCTACLGNDRG